MQVRIHGLNSESFTPTRGTRQGCPLLPLLFAIVIELLAIAIRNNSQIKGVEIHNVEYKTRLFADDAILYLTEPLNSLKYVNDELSLFWQNIRFAGHSEKKQIYPIHIIPEHKSLIRQIYNFKWTISSWRQLGVHIPLQLDNLLKYNFGETYKTVKTKFDKWQSYFFHGEKELTALNPLFYRNSPFYFIPYQ